MQGLIVIGMGISPKGIGELNCGWNKRFKSKNKPHSAYIASTRCGLKLKEFFNEVTLQEGTISTHIDLWEQTLISTIRSMFFLTRDKREDGADLLKERGRFFFHLCFLPFLI